MISFTRSLSQLADLRAAAPRRLVLALASAVTLSTALLLAAAPAGAVVKTVEITPSTSVTVGLQPREVSRYFEGTRKWNGLAKDEVESNVSARSFGNPTGSPVLHSASTYVIYWDPQYFYHAEWQHTVDQFMEHLGTASGQLSSTFAVDAQYSDKTNAPATDRSTFLGAGYDTNPYPTPSECTDPRPFEEPSPPLFASSAPLVENLAVCLTDAQVRTQLETFIKQHNLPKGMGTIFYLLTPPGVAVCLDSGGATGHCSEFEGSSAENPLAKIEEDEQEKAKQEKEGKIYTEPASYVSYKNSFCSYHDAIGNGNASTILYAVIPWTVGGEGDNQLAKGDKTPAYDCQDGGFEPGKKPNGEIEEKEAEKATLTPLEEEEFKKKDEQEKREQQEAKELGLTGPHEQEPNQLGDVRSEDGSYDAGLADLVINQIAIEQQNIVTDPLLNGWQQQAGEHYEVTDECRNFFAPTTGGVSANPLTRAGTLSNQAFAGKSYYLNDTFNLAALELDYPGVPCLNGINLDPQFTAPNPVNSGEVVGFDGMESNVTLDWALSFPHAGSPTPTYPTYTWNFGDETPTVSGYAPATALVNSPGSTPCEAPWLAPCAGSVFHSYQYGGTYNVTLTIRDTGGNEASVTEPITVVGPSRPLPPPPSPPEANSGGSGSPASSSTPPPPANVEPPIPGPVASTAVVSHSLPSTLRKGLVVRYAVNEQVAGHFEVLIAASVAKRIGLHGAPATELATGTPPQIVIANAILVTTKGGHNTIKIKFGKKTAAKLRKLSKVSLMIRLVVRNASSHGPLTTTVLSTFTLTR